MARLRSVLRAGYFPLPDEAVGPIAALCPLDGLRHCVIDPCAGDGAALAGLLRAWGPAMAATRLRAREAWEAFAVELEAGRAAALADLARGDDAAVGGADLEVAQGDAMAMPLPDRGAEEGATVLYLNPPYDLDPTWGRLEARWLERWTRRLGPGGALIFVVPAQALPACADLLGHHYDAPVVLRFPAPHFATFKQVVVFARRVAIASDRPTCPDATRTMLDAAARSPMALAPLWGPGAPPEPVVRPAGRPLPKVDPRGGWRAQETPPIAAATWRCAEQDWAGAIAEHRPWEAQARKGRRVRVRAVAPERGLADLGARSYPLATRPKPGHIAAAIACGVYNGVKVAPSADGRAAGLPDVLIKGAFDRRFREVEVRCDKDGNPVASVQVQQPRLRVTVLDLSDYQCHELASSTEPTEARTLGLFSVGDLLMWYGDGLLEVLRDRCPLRFGAPAPDDTRARLAEAGVLRRPFDAQAEVIAAAAAGLREDGRFWVQGQTGTGKTTMALCALALAGSRRPLVMAPPHLCERTWPDEVAAVWGPDALVVPVRGPADLYALEALRGDPRRVVAVMPREAAKLGYGVVGVAGPRACGAESCRRCGSPIGVAPDKRASRRATCKAEIADVAAMTPGQRAAHDFARAVALVVPAGADPALEALLGGAAPRLLAQRDRIRAAADAAERAKGKGAAAAAELRAQATARAAAVQDAARRAAWDLALAAGDLAAGGNLPTGRARRRKGEARTHYSAPAKAAGAALRAACRALWAADAPGSWLVGAAEEWLALAAGVPKSERHWESPFAELCQHARWLLAEATAQGAGVCAAEVAAPHIAAVPPSVLRASLYAYERREHVGGWLLDLADEGSTISVGGGPGDYGAALEAAVAAFGAPARRACGEPWWTAVPEPRRVPLARLVAERVDALGIDAVVVDEAHEYNAANSAQGAAARILRGLGRPVLYLTGSTNNGYAEHLFEPLQALSADFRAEFGPRDHARFQDRYGYVRRSVDLTGQGASAAGAGRAEQVEVEYGAHSDRIVSGGVRVLGKAPGVMPEAILRWLLPHAGTVDLGSVQRDLPGLTERLVRVAPDPDQAARAARLLDEVLREIRATRKDPNKRGKLFGALAGLPGYYDLCRDGPAAEGLPDFEVRYPAQAKGERGEVVAAVPAHPPGSVLPKERALADEVRAQLGRGRPCLVLVYHRPLIEATAAQLRALLPSGARVAHLPESVTAQKREAWISALLARGCDVLVSNPTRVSTGLNNLIHFCTQIWLENPGCNPYIRRQVTGRALRIGQTREVEIVTLVYDDALAAGNAAASDATAGAQGRPARGALQVAAHELLAHKIGVSEAVDGLDATAALQAAGVGDQDATASLSVGRALYAMLTR